jgi:hypothetical protein
MCSSLRFRAGCAIDTIADVVLQRNIVKNQKNQKNQKNELFAFLVFLAELVRNFLSCRR